MAKITGEASSRRGRSNDCDRSLLTIDLTDWQTGCLTRAWHHAPRWTKKEKKMIDWLSLCTLIFVFLPRECERYSEMLVIALLESKRKSTSKHRHPSIAFSQPPPTTQLVHRLYLFPYTTTLHHWIHPSALFIIFTKSLRPSGYQYTWGRTSGLPNIYSGTHRQKSKFVNRKKRYSNNTVGRRGKETFRHRYRQTDEHLFQTTRNQKEQSVNPKIHSTPRFRLSSEIKVYKNL